MQGLGRFEVVARRRPVDLLAPGAVDLDPGDERPLAVVAPFVAVVAEVRGAPVSVVLAGAHAHFEAVLSDDVVSLRVAAGHRTSTEASTHRSRRHGRTTGSVDGLALSLTGTWLTAFTRHDGTWTGRARFDLAGRCEPREAAWLATVHAGSTGPVTRLRAGGFGQLGLRDLRLVSHAAGSPYGDGDGRVLLTATSAGPGFFDTAHASVWSLDPGTCELEHRADLFVRRPALPDGRTLVLGDHAVHLVRDADGWLLAGSTWGDFDRDRRLRPGELGVGVTLARSDADLTRGRHVLDARPWALPVSGVGAWDPHLVRTPDGWLVGSVQASRFFRFHPALAGGPSLDELVPLATAADRRATEGTTLVRLGDRWRVAASDGRDSRRGVTPGFPVFDLDLREIGRLDATYPTNLPWPTLLPTGEGWLMVGFDATPYGGDLLGYGTHGRVVVQRSTTTLAP